LWHGIAPEFLLSSPSCCAAKIRWLVTAVFFYHPEHGIEDIEIGYRLNPDYWNRGLITEAARAVRDHGFRDWKLPRVISLIHPQNIPSRRVAEKNGMKIEKEITFRGFPTLVYAMTREQWLAKHYGG
jgi:RimJ/RimL family protein N-acetyltransferase